ATNLLSHSWVKLWTITRFFRYLVQEAWVRFIEHATKISIEMSPSKSFLMALHQTPSDGASRGKHVLHPHSTIPIFSPSMKSNRWASTASSYLNSLAVKHCVNASLAAACH